MGVNQFTIYTDDEFMMLFLDPKPDSMIPQFVDETMPNDANIDWTNKGMVSPIKNQGQCGSCWAFSATGVLESWALMNNKKVSLSEQQLVDCSGSYGNHGCNGGLAQRALDYVKDKGIAS